MAQSPGKDHGGRRGRTPVRSVLLVNPPQHGLLEGFSSSLVALASFLSRECPGLEIGLLDLGLSSGEELDDSVRRAAAKLREPAVVGITSTTASYQGALAVARAFRSEAPGALVVLGGHHATPQAEVVLRHHPEVDAVVVGEGERALLGLCTRWRELDSVPNLVFRRGSTFVRTEPAPLLSTEELDGIEPWHSGWGLESAPGKFEHATYVSARGCPLKCSFCAVSNQAIRAKSIPAVLRDLRLLVQRHGHRRIALEDNFFAHSLARTLPLCTALEGLRKEIDFTWDCQTRVESMARADVLAAMERAGCEAVYLGVEALAPELVAYLGKAPRPERYLALLEETVVPALLDSTVDCYVNLQLGIHVETEAMRRQTLEVLGRLGRLAARRGRVITVFPQLAVVYPGTSHFASGLAERRFGPAGEEVFEPFTAWEAEQQPVLRWLGENFAHGTGGLPEGLLDAGRLAQGEFEVNPAAVETIASQLRRMSELEGVRVFRYGRYLAGHETEAPRLAAVG